MGREENVAMGMAEVFQRDTRESALSSVADMSREGLEERFVDDTMMESM